MSVRSSVSPKKLDIQTHLLVSILDTQAISMTASTGSRSQHQTNSRTQQVNAHLLVIPLPTQISWFLFEGLLPLIGAGLIYLLWGVFRYLASTNNAAMTDRGATSAWKPPLVAIICDSPCWIYIIRGT